MEKGNNKKTSGLSLYYVTHISSEQAVFEGLLSLFPLSSSSTIVSGSTPP